MKGMGRWDDGKGGLAHWEGIRQKHRSVEVGAARSATLCRIPDYAEFDRSESVGQGGLRKRFGIIRSAGQVIVER